jgi:hypothetical protein
MPTSSQSLLSCPWGFAKSRLKQRAAGRRYASRKAGRHGGKWRTQRGISITLPITPLDAAQGAAEYPKPTWKDRIVTRHEVIHIPSATALRGDASILLPVARRVVRTGVVFAVLAVQTHHSTFGQP